MKQFFKDYNDLFKLLMLYIIIGNAHLVILPFSRVLFQSNPDISSQWVYFAFMFGLTMWLMWFLFEAPIFRKDKELYGLKITLLLLVFVRLVLNFGVISPFFSGDGMHTSSYYFDIFRNRGIYRAEILDNYGIPSIFYIFEILLLIKSIMDRARIFIDDNCRERLSVKDVNIFLKRKSAKES